MAASGWGYDGPSLTQKQECMLCRPCYCCLLAAGASATALRVWNAHHLYRTCYAFYLIYMFYIYYCTGFHITSISRCYNSLPSPTTSLTSCIVFSELIMAFLMPLASTSWR